MVQFAMERAGAGDGVLRMRAWNVFACDQRTWVPGLPWGAAEQRRVPLERMCVDLQRRVLRGGRGVRDLF